jgi:hypothetical protein
MPRITGWLMCRWLDLLPRDRGLDWGFLCCLLFCFLFCFSGVLTHACRPPNFHGARVLMPPANCLIEGRLWYRDRGIPYRRGYLLHGPRGNYASLFLNIPLAENRLRSDSLIHGS